MKKNGVFLFVISHLVPEIFKIFVLCKLGTDDVIRCDNMEVKTRHQYLICIINLEYLWNERRYDKKENAILLHF